MASTASNETRHYDTIVVGAGMSGLACASKLFQHQRFRQKNSMLVLEGRERIGGRIGSVHVQGSRLDTGANWIHGIGTADKPNPLVNILPHKKNRELSGTVVFGLHGDAKDEYEVMETGNEEWMEVQKPSTRDRTHGRTGIDDVVPSEIAGPLFSALWQAIGELHEMAQDAPADEAKRTPVLKALSKTESLRDAFNTIPTEYHSVLSALPQFIESMEAAPLSAQSAEHPEDIPGMSLLEYAIDDFDGDQVFLQDGYSAVIEELAKELVKADLIRTGTKVNKINWGSQPLSVETSNDIYFAKNIVCTLPLGVLKHLQNHANSEKHSPFFQPALPKEKQEAIANLGFGTLDKILPVYSRPWWNEEPYFSVIQKGLVNRRFSSSNEGHGQSSSEQQAPDSLLGFTNELPGIALHQDGSTSVGPQRLSVINLHALTGFPALSVFVACSTATQIEAFTDDHVSNLLHRAFTDWFGHEPPRPEAIHVTRWSQDEFSRGSYSHMVTSLSETNHRVEFQKPVESDSGTTLRFAGEHTSRNHFATVHGALLSGWREADAILQTV